MKGAKQSARGPELPGQGSNKERNHGRCPGSAKREPPVAVPPRRAALCILLPFASGYYLSYLFRTIGALVSDRLIVELHLTPGSLVLGRPRVLVLDEPSLGLARIVVAGIYRTLARLREEGLTIPLIEQAATTAIAFADRTAVLVGGRVVLQGGRDELLASGAVVRHYLGITDAA